MASSEDLTVEDVQREELPEEGVEPTMINVRSEGLKLDLVLLKNRVSGLTIDYQGISESDELRKWIKIIQGMIFGFTPSPEGSIPKILVEAVMLPASQQRRLRGPQEELQENAEPTMINVRSEGLKLDLVLLKNRVSGLTIDYQGISESDELRKWLGIVEGMLSDSAPSPEGSIPQVLGEGARPPASQPQPLKEKQAEPLKEKQAEPLKEEQEEPLKEKQAERPEANDYRRIVLHAVDISLDTLGHDGKHAVLSLLENRYGLRETDIPDHPRGFVVLLDELLGPSAQALEREIMSNIRLVSAAPGENLETVIRSLKEQSPAKAPVEAATEDPWSVLADANTTGFGHGATRSKPGD